MTLIIYDFILCLSLLRTLLRTPLKVFGGVGELELVVVAKRVGCSGLIESFAVILMTVLQWLHRVSHVSYKEWASVAQYSESRWL